MTGTRVQPVNTTGAQFLAGKDRSNSHSRTNVNVETILELEVDSVPVTIRIRKGRVRVEFRTLSAAKKTFSLLQGCDLRCLLDPIDRASRRSSTRIEIVVGGMVVARLGHVDVPRAPGGGSRSESHC